MQKRKIKIKNNRKHLLILMSAFFLIVGISLLVIKYYNLNEIKKQDEKNIEIFFQEIPENSDEKTDTDEVQDNIQNTTTSYVAVLEIPKINLKRGLVDKNSKANNVNRNIYTLKESIFPNENNISHIILASHSGSGNYSYFNKLKNLDMNDQVFLYYKGIKYIYEVVNKYEVEKTGKVNLKLTSSSDITLITCISGTNKQIVYVGQLVQKEKY